MQDACVILCGGASRRMGRDKALLAWDGERAVDRLARLSRNLGLGEPYTAGADHGFAAISDDTPGAGPCGGIIAAAPLLRTQGVRRMLVLAVDAPTIAPDDLQPLLQTARPGATFAGQPLPLWIWLDAIPVDAEAGWPLRRFVEVAGLSDVDAPRGAEARIRGANTPADYRRLQASLLEP